MLIETIYKINAKTYDKNEIIKLFHSSKIAKNQ